jgi:hypothetical protein
MRTLEGLWFSGGAQQDGRSMLAPRRLEYGERAVRWSIRRPARLGARPAVFEDPL